MLLILKAFHVDELSMLSSQEGFRFTRAQEAKNASDQNKSPGSEHLDQIEEKDAAITTDFGWERNNKGMRRELEPQTDVSEPATLED
jgi:hypothetical protein